MPCNTVLHGTGIWMPLDSKMNATLQGNGRNELATVAVAAAVALVMAAEATAPKLQAGRRLAHTAERGGRRAPRRVVSRR